MSSIFIVAVCAASVFSMWAIWGEIQLLETIRDGGLVTPDEALGSDNRVALSGLVYLIVFIPSVVVFLMWVNRSVKNLAVVRTDSTGEALRFTPGWAVGWYFIPVMNLFKPYQAMDELHRRSAPVGTATATVKWWWGLWILGGVVGPGITGFFGDATLSSLIAGDYRELVADVVVIAAAVPLILLLQRITGWQESRAGELFLS